MTEQIPSFPTSLVVPVRNVKTGVTYAMIRADQVRVDQQQLSTITRICNEPAIPPI